MESNGKRYWRGIEELENDLEFVKNAEKEFPDAPAIVEEGSLPNRRDFLKLMGFSVAAVSVAACQTPVKKAIPYLLKPNELDPSIASYYASAYFEDGDFAHVLVKTREGRPIKVEGNDLSPINGGKTSAKTQASVLSLYDITRYKGFMKGKNEIAMDKADEEIKAKLAEAKSIRLISSTVISPSTKAAIKSFLDKYKDADAKHIMYDALSASGILAANKESFGVAAIPSYDFSKAEVIVSFNCDFLGTWISPVEFSRQYAQNRKVGKDKKEMSRFYAFESRLSMTGANADYRTAIKPSQEGAAIASLYKKLTGGDTFKDEKVNKALDRLVKDLKNAQGKALVVSGSNDTEVQTIVNAINHHLGSYGNTIDINTPCYLRQGMDADMDAFIAEAGNTDVVIFYGVNPCYSHPKAGKLKEALGKVKTKISFAMRPNETANLCDYVCPNNHYLESWGDVEPKKGLFGLVQPTITPIFKTRQAQESLLVWAGAKTTNFYDFVRGYWSKNIFPAQKQYKNFDEFWANALHDGVFAANVVAKAAPAEEKKETKEAKENKAGDKEDKPRVAVAGAFKGDVEGALSDIAKEYKADSADLEIQLYEKVAIGSGMNANNPWLQEMPDPITRACWGNYVCISRATAEKKGVAQNDVVKVTANGYSFELPVLIQPGQANDTLSVAIGYGRTATGKVGQGVGADVFPLVNAKGFHAGVTISKTDKTDRIAQTQTHHTIMGRDIIQEASLKEYQKNPSAGRNLITIHTEHGPKRPTDISLWKGHTYPNHSWSLLIDLNTCTGCGACVVACQVENNVPVVGKREILMSREMHWIRIDRYYSSEANATIEQAEKGKTEGSYGEMEQPSDNPEVTFMPLMCQHCNNAPCETVCPVLATTHSNEGLNQMAYNRCVGTRYCANNCPFKVRRFNWFHYAEDDRFTDVNATQTSDLGRMVLNPDVTVRTRGVMEKCTMCVQRIQAGKLEAKKEKRRTKDGDIQTACSQVCPTGAIIFGDMLDETSQIGKLVIEEHDKRAYHLLEEINVKPQIGYLSKIRNTEEGKARFGAEAHGEHQEHKEHKEEKGAKKEEKHS